MKAYYEEFFEDDEDLNKDEKEYKKQILKYWFSGKSKEFNITYLNIERFPPEKFKEALWKELNKTVNEKIKSKFRKN